MSITVEAMQPFIPSLGAVRAGSAVPGVQAQGASAVGSKPKPDPGTSGITPVPIQPLSNQMLATFMAKDIELYGSMFGA